MDKIQNNQARSTNDLSGLLLLLIIFSMFLSLRVSSLRYLLDGSNSIISGGTGVFDLLIVPVVMGLVFLSLAFATKEKSLRKIYFFSIMPFIIDTKLLYFLNQSLVAVANVLVTSVIIFILFLYIAKNYRREKPE